MPGSSFRVTAQFGPTQPLPLTLTSGFSVVGVKDQLVPQPDSERSITMPGHVSRRQALGIGIGMGVGVALGTSNAYAAPTEKDSGAGSTCAW